MIRAIHEQRHNMTEFATIEHRTQDGLTLKMQNLSRPTDPLFTRTQAAKVFCCFWGNIRSQFHFNAAL